MRNKESTIAVMVAVMLGAASLLGGISAIPALAIHDSDAVQIASETISQDDEESMIIDTVEFTAKKSTTRASGSVTVEILQDSSIVDSQSISTEQIGTFNTDLGASFGGLNVTGDFEILVEYLGTGLVTVTNVQVLEGTEVAEQENPDSEGPAEDEEPNTPSEEEIENVIASKTLAPDSEDGMAIETVEFTAVKSTTRASGTLTVAILQDDSVLDSDSVSSSEIGTFNTDLEATFDDLEVEDDFKVVFMYEGSGVVTISGINVPSATEPAGNPDNLPPPPPPPPLAGTGSITVYAHRVPSEFWGPTFTGANAQMWFSLHNSTGYIVFAGYYDESGTTVTGLNEGETHYIYASDCDECHLDDHDVVFDHWEDGGTDNPRTLTTLVDQHAWYRYEPDVGQ
jgi:hypothetical protein